MTRRKIMSIAGSSTIGAALLLMCNAANAFAGSAGDPGSNIGHWITGLAKGLLIPIAGIFGLGAFARRDVGAAVTIFVLALIVGIFVYDGPGAATMIGKITKTFTGS